MQPGGSLEYQFAAASSNEMIRDLVRVASCHTRFLCQTKYSSYACPGSIVSQIQPKVFTDIQMSRIKYNYYINNVPKDYDDSQQNGIVEDSVTPQE
jgi:hypothetical protein